MPNQWVYFDTLPPKAISDELAPTIDELGLHENCKELAEQGWTVLRDVASREFNRALRNTIVEIAKNQKSFRMLLAKDDLFAEAAMNAKIMALAEFSVGRGFLISQVASSIRPQGSQPLQLHADQNWVPAPFPEHNLLLTACWALDEFTKENGSTLVIPGSNRRRRHPDLREISELKGAIAVECPAGSAVLWDGNVWHGNWKRTNPGTRVVCHITYSRLMMRPVEDYGAVSDDLIEKHGDPMAQLLGRKDFLTSSSGADYTKLIQTFNNARR